MAISGLFGFFYRIGSSDYPVNYDPNLPFGFDRGNPDETIFNYSVNEVEDAFGACRTLMRPAYYDATMDNSDIFNSETGSVNIILAEYSKENYGDIKNENISSTSNAANWDALFRIAEFLHNNQSSVIKPPLTSDYINWGDEMLANTHTGESVNPYHVGKYVKGSLRYVSRATGSVSSQTRLTRVSFSLIFNETDTVTVELYFDADAFVERSDNIKYDVYRYTDSDNPSDGKISPDEMDQGVVGILFDKLKSGKYKQYTCIFIDKRISDDDYVREQFFVLSTINKPINDVVAIAAIKDYLLNEYTKQGKEKDLRYDYPTLFNENKVYIIPIYDNGIATGTNTNVKHALSLTRLNTELSEFVTDLNNPPVEIFHVGPGNEWSPGSNNNTSEFRFLFPILAIEASAESSSAGTLPISNRFPAYYPIYGTQENNELPGEFHYILMRLMEYLYYGLPEIGEDFKDAYKPLTIYEKNTSFEGSTIGINRKRVSFVFDGDLFILFGPKT
jgi:hypothetical protein